METTSVSVEAVVALRERLWVSVTAVVETTETISVAVLARQRYE